MIKSNKQIEIVRSANKGYSSMSQESAEGVLGVLKKHYLTPRLTTIHSFSDLQAVVRRKPDLVFVGMECIPIDDNYDLNNTNTISIAQYFDKQGIAYTGSSRSAHELSRNKALAKQHIVAAGLATSPFFVIKQNQNIADKKRKLSFPLFIKPTNRGGGEGIDSKSVVHTDKQLNNKIGAIKNTLYADSLIEKYLPGREFSVAILQKEFSPQYEVMPIELIAPADNHGDRILGNKVKSSNAEKTLKLVDTDVKANVNKLALQVFCALKGRDYGRIDIRLDSDGRPHFLEANLIPSLISGYGSFPKSCVLNIGLKYERMILRIVRLGLARRKNSATDILKSSAIRQTAYPSANFA